MKSLATVCLILFPAATLFGGGDYFPPPDSKGGWRTLKDPAKIRKVAGLDPAKLDEAFEYTKETSQHGGLLVVRHGYLVYERYFGKGDHEAMPESASCGKAVTSIAVGIALKEKHDLIPAGLDEKVITPRYLPPEAFPLNDPRKEEITLGQLLTMTAGLRGTNPGYVNFKPVTLDPPETIGLMYITDVGALEALREPLWCPPGGGYSYAGASPQLASMVLRKLTGMEMEDYVRSHIAEPTGWGLWTWAMYRPKLRGGIDKDGRLLHTPGPGSIALRPTDMLRFAYLLLHEGKWGERQIVPAEYVRMCGRMSKYDPHWYHSLEFNVNEDGHLEGVPKDAFWKTGAGGFGMFIIPSLDMVIWKVAGNDSHYNPALTRLPVLYKYDGSRDNWKAADSKIVGEGPTKTLQKVVASVIP